MSDKAQTKKVQLSNAELELTQKIQRHFPRGEILPDVLEYFNGCSTKIINKILFEAFYKIPKLPLIEIVGHVYIPPTTAPFIVRHNFKPKDKCGEKSIVYYSKYINFPDLFNDIVDPFGGDVLQYATLLRSSRAKNIFDEISGAEINREICLAEVFALAKGQASGQPDALLVDGHPNIFYIRDIRGRLHSVGIEWHESYWYIYSYPFDRVWGKGSRIFYPQKASLLNP